jgi:hypothetical protein
MRKIPTLFKRVFDDGAMYITREVTPGLEWVLEGKGEATEKVDGSAVARINGVWYKRFDAKRGRRIPPGSIACQPIPDLYTGHWPHWTPADLENPSNRWFKAAVGNTPWIGDADGTFELVGKHLQGNPYGLDDDFLERHGRIKIKDCPRTFDGIEEYLRTHEIEGIVWWLDGEPRCKIKRTDFGFKWPVEERE